LTRSWRLHPPLYQQIGQDLPVLAARFVVEKRGAAWKYRIVG
jgi:hypothetical protein